MKLEKIVPDTLLWERTKKFARECSWRAGIFLAQDMDNGVFDDWQGVIVASEGENLCGFCTVAKTDCIPDVPYTPYIGYLFVEERYRGHRLSEKLICYAMAYLREQKFDQVYLVSDHENFYEKYGFSVIDRKPTPWGEVEKIYRHPL